MDCVMPVLLRSGNINVSYNVINVNVRKYNNY